MLRIAIFVSLIPLLTAAVPDYSFYNQIIQPGLVPFSVLAISGVYNGFPDAGFDATVAPVQPFDPAPIAIGNQQSRWPGSSEQPDQGKCNIVNKYHIK